MFFSSLRGTIGSNHVLKLAEGIMSRIISRQLLQTSSCDLFIQIEIKKLFFFVGAESRDNICKKKG